MRGIRGSGKWAKYIHLKGKIAGKTDKSGGKTNGHKGKRNNTGAERAHGHVFTTTGRGWHHELPVVAPARSRTPAPQTLRFGACLVHMLCLCWSFWAYFAIFLDPLGPQKHLLNLSFRLGNLNSAKTLKTSKTTHNRRNRGINHIIIHFNPLKRLLNTQLIHANMALIKGLWVRV